MIPFESGAFCLRFLEVMFAMPTNINFQNLQSNKSASNQVQSDDSVDIIEIERELKNIWAKYVRTVESHGSNNDAEHIRAKYFALYRRYRQNKRWKNTLTNN